MKKISPALIYHPYHSCQILKTFLIVFLVLYYSLLHLLAICTIQSIHLNWKPSDLFNYCPDCFILVILIGYTPVRIYDTANPLVEHLFLLLGHSHHYIATTEFPRLLHVTSSFQVWARYAVLSWSLAWSPFMPVSLHTKSHSRSVVPSHFESGDVLRSVETFCQPSICDSAVWSRVATTPTRHVACWTGLGKADSVL